MSKLLPFCIVLLAACISVSAQPYTVLHNFGSKAGDPSQPVPPGTIAQSRGGVMLTTAPDPDATGKVFRIYTNGSVQVLHQFNGSDGSLPVSGLTLAIDGQFYGTTQTGGKFNFGTIFKMSPGGTVTTLHDFTGGTDGEYPIAVPIESVYGDLYGTTAGDGKTSFGTVYKITRDGNFALLHTFTGSDGSQPHGRLLQGKDFWFYGTASAGGLYGSDPYGLGSGTIFRINRSGEFEVLYNFDGFHGGTPYAGLIQANNGNFYGVTYRGGHIRGVLFRMTPDHQVTIVHSFAGGSDGDSPAAELVQATDGYLYGTCTQGGDYGIGVLFRSSTKGDLIGLHEFNWQIRDGNSPAPLVQHTDGMLYGETTSGGKYGKGIVYSVDAGLPPFVTYLPVYGRAGALVQILGQGFTDTSEVFFNGTPATFKLVYPTYIRATVPDGATSGPITVTTANGTLTSNKLFIVHP